LPGITSSDARREWLVSHLKLAQAEYARVLRNARESGRQQYALDDWIWNALVGSMATYGSAKRAKNIEPFRAQLAWSALADVTPDDRRSFLRTVMNLTSQRPGPDRKGDWLANNFESLLKSGGPGEFRTRFEVCRQLSNVEQLLGMLDEFEGIGEKYARNIIMDAALDIGMRFVAIDDRLKKIGAWLIPGFEQLPYREQERLFAELGEQAGLPNAWTLDRLLFHSYGEDLAFKQQIGAQGGASNRPRNCP
jgi:hypothetical protein